MPALWVVIPTWNRKQELLSCLDSLCNADYEDMKVVVVDNCSTDGTVAAVQARFPQVNLIRLPRNLGATGASNRGFDVALENGAEYVLRLDSDTIVSPTAVSRLMEMAHRAPEAAVFAAKIYYADAPCVIWSAGAYRNRWHLGGVNSARMQLDSARTLNPRTVDYAWSTAMLIRSEVLRDVGGFDPAFLVYYEEVDFCLRVRAAGYEIMYVPQAHVWHRVGSSAQSPQIAYNWNRSKAILYRKHTHGVHRLTVIAFAFTYALASGIFWRRLGGNRGPMRSALRGLIDGFRTPLVHIAE